MKWFKHMADMLDDLFVVSILDEYGMEGYGVWVGLLEIYARYCGDQPGDMIEIPWSVFESKFRVSRRKLRKFYQSFAKLSKIHFEEVGSSVKLQIPKMLDLRDEWARKKEKNSGVTPDQLRNKKTEDKNTEDRNKNFKKITTTTTRHDSPQETDGGSGGGEEKKYFKIRRQGHVISESEWIRQYLHIHKGLEDAGMRLNDFITRYFDTRKIYNRWMAHAPPERMAAYLYTQLESSAENELLYAIRCADNHGWRDKGYLAYLKEAITRESQGLLEVEIR